MVECGNDGKFVFDVGGGSVQNIWSLEIHPSLWDNDHHEIAFRRSQMGFAERPLSEAELRHARWIYYGMVAFLDHEIGRVLDALAGTGMADDTIVVYSSDHGDMLGDKGLFMKSVMYESAASR